MPYVDRERGRETAVSGIAAGLLVGGIGFVLVTGLAMNVVRTREPPLIVRNWALPTPPPPPPLTTTRIKPRSTEIRPVAAPRTNETLVPVERHDMIVLPVGTNASAEAIGNVVQALPPPPAVDRSSRAAPLGNPGESVTTDDYPPSALRAGREGTTGFRIDIGSDGRATACTIVASSGSDELDRTACRVLMRRARFAPAHDAAGIEVAASYTSRIAWRVPAD